MYRWWNVLRNSYQKGQLGCKISIQYGKSILHHDNWCFYIKKQVFINSLKIWEFSGVQLNRWEIRHTLYFIIISYCDGIFVTTLETD